MKEAYKLGIRWTLGNVSERGYELLRLSIAGAYKLFGPEAAYAVCANNININAAQAKVGNVPADVIWHDATHDVPAFLKPFMDAGMAEGVGWKLAPMHFFHDRYELALDNDCILWAVPPAVETWLTNADKKACVVAEDVVAYFGQFADVCPNQPRNGGIRGLPPRFDLQGAMCSLLDERPGIQLTSETDEQGLQTAAIARMGNPFVVTIDEVTICSPFYPHRPYFGTHGAHFVASNAHHIPWNYYDRPADDVIAEFWAQHRPQLYANVGLPFPD